MPEPMPSLEIGVDETSWDALEREALYDPVLYQAVTLARRHGDRERALIAAAIVLSRLHRRATAREVERLMNEPATLWRREELSR